MNTTEELIRRVVTEAMIPDNERLWTADDIGQYLGVCRRQVTERYAKRPDFPRPVILSGLSSIKAHRRWYMVEVLRWARRNRD